MKLFQIYEIDLETLEQNLPKLQDFVSFHPNYNERKDVQEILAMLKKTVSDVRWNYGPPTEVEVNPDTSATQS